MRIRRVLVANRSEIAVRIIRAARELGLATVQAHSTADADSLAVQLADEAVAIGPPPAAKSYLNVPALLEAAARTGCDAVHPGYGFLAEDASFAEAVTQVVVDRGELTLHVRREHLVEVCHRLRDDPALRFELCSSVSGVDYPDTPERLHAVYHLTSMTYRRRIRLEVAASAQDPHIPSVVSVYPTADWQERETYDMYGIVFDGHPGLTRILMPDDWDGFPQRKDYPLGGVPVEYHDATIPPPDTRRAYR